MIGASDDDLKLLVAKNFIIPFESGVVVIKHWKIHNYIRQDRKHDTKYTDEMNLLKIKDNGAYTILPDACQSHVSQLVDTLDTEVRLGKDSIGKVNAEDISSVNDYTEDELLHLRDMWNQRADTHPVESIKPMMKRYDNLRLCLRLCDKQRIYDEVANIDNQAFFQKLKSEGRPVKFDWFFKPDNFQKVLEGNYLQEFKKQEQEKPKNKFDNFEQREYEDDFFAQLEQKMGG